MTDGEERKNPDLPNDSAFLEIEEKANELRHKLKTEAHIGTKAPSRPARPVGQAKNGGSQFRTQDDPNDYKALGVGISISYYLVGSMAFGLICGALLDKLTHSSLYLGICGMFGALFGIYVTFVLINKSNLNK